MSAEREQLLRFFLAEIDNPKSLISERDRPYLTKWVTEMPEWEVRRRAEETADLT